MNLPSGDEEGQKRIELERLIVGYIDRIIKFDADLGRNEKNFFEQNYAFIAKNIHVFREKGFRIFIGGGNIFFLKIERKLTGWIANCLQMRGLAQRKIQIREIGETIKC